MGASGVLVPKPDETTANRGNPTPERGWTISGSIVRMAPDTTFEMILTIGEERSELAAREGPARGTKPGDRSREQRAEGAMK